MVCVCFEEVVQIYTILAEKSFNRPSRAVEAVFAQLENFSIRYLMLDDELVVDIVDGDGAEAFHRALPKEERRLLAVHH